MDINPGEKTVKRMVVLGCTFLGTMVALALAARSDIEGSAEVVVVDDLLAIPEDRVEVITVEPSHEYVWVPGYWERDPGKWTWAKGRWEIPPDRQVRGADGHWRYDMAKWRWMRGHWKVASLGYIVDEFIAVPVGLDEVRPQRPSRRHHWVSGYWEWDGYRFWKPGYWTLKPHPHAEWVPGHWDAYGLTGWRWITGHWNVR